MRLDYYYQIVNMRVVSRVRIAEQLETQDIRILEISRKFLQIIIIIFIAKCSADFQTTTPQIFHR